MHVRTRRWSSLGGSALAVIGIALLAFALFGLRAEGADHKDSPSVEGDAGADITDVYAFRSPTNPNNLVVALDVNPLTPPSANANTNFASGVDYRIHVDNNGDLNADATVVVKFTGNDFTVSGLGNTPITGKVTPAGTAPMVTDAGGIKVFAGLRDDPFFFDLTGFKAFVAGPYTPANGLRQSGQTPADTFAGTNVSAIVIELPITALTGAANANTGTIKAWVSTARGSNQVDRMAIPAINTALIPSTSKNAFNQASPSGDVATFRPMAQASVTGLRDAVKSVLPAEDGGPLGKLTPEQVAGALIPDVVTIDFSKDVVFPNGRRLQDDVIDAALGIVLNRGGAKGVGDAVNANDKAFLGTFPYLAEPFMAAAQASPTATAGASGTTMPVPPKTGNAGLTDEGSSLGWQLALGGGALLIVAGSALVVRRRPSR
ncbi:MAG: DUF4331 domain-containing protein [Dehalococcoidia bacterium]|nr:DUF4331 domain-containing protein [Dehalococcoidia bacterium]